MLQSLSNLDAGILLFIQNNLRVPWLTAVLQFFSALGNMGAIWFVIAVLLFIRRKTRRIGTESLASLVICIVLGSGILKHLIERPRPFLTHPEIIPISIPQTFYSFPSGHASAAFAMIFILWWLVPRKYSIPALILGLVICFARMYFGVHYPSDILGGILCGYVSALIAHYICGRFWKWIDRERPAASRRNRVGKE